VSAKRQTLFAIHLVIEVAGGPGVRPIRAFNPPIAGARERFRAPCVISHLMELAVQSSKSKKVWRKPAVGALKPEPHGAMGDAEAVGAASREIPERAGQRQANRAVTPRPWRRQDVPPPDVSPLREVADDEDV
jgi:hypothetical protein